MGVDACVIVIGVLLPFITDNRPKPKAPKATSTITRLRIISRSYGLIFSSISSIILDTMAHRKAGGSAKNLTDSNPKYLGIKLYDGQHAQPGSILVRQRGTKVMAGENVRVGKDHTLFSTTEGKVKFTTKRKTGFDGNTRSAKLVSVVKEK